MANNEKPDKKNDIAARKRRDELRRFRLNAGIVLLLTLLLILIAMNWNRVISPFKDAALDVGKGGFPVNLPGSAGYVLDEFGENFCLLTDTYLYTYTAEGANIASTQHGFQNPFCSTSSKRILVYDRNGRGLRCYSRTGELFSANTEDTIVFGKMGSDDRCGVVTTSARFANSLCVYNAEGSMIFRYYSPNKKIMQICFSDNDKSVFMTLLGEKGGEFSLSAARINIDTATTDLMWETKIGNEVTYSLENASDGLYIVTAGGSLLLDRETGEINQEAAFSKEISGIPQSDGLHAVIFRDSGSNGDVIVTYNGELEAVNSVSHSRIEAFDAEKGKLYLLTGSTLQVYDSALEQVNEYELDDVYSDIKIIGSYAYLLGYNSVQRIQL